MDNLLNTENKIFEYVRKNSFSDKNNITAKTMIFRDGILDSMAFILLIDFIEEAFGIKVGDQDLVEENFESVEAITRYITRKKEIVS